MPQTGHKRWSKFRLLCTNLNYSHKITLQTIDGNSLSQILRSYGFRRPSKEFGSGRFTGMSVQLWMYYKATRVTETKVMMTIVTMTVIRRFLQI